MNRRNFIFASSAAILTGIVFSNSVFSADNESDEFLQFISGKIKKEDKNLPVGELMMKIALLFEGVPYIGGTLDKDIIEKCTVNFKGLDCVTFFENTLCMARCIKKDKITVPDLLNEITYTRYRNGNINNYTSRLHYTSDWILDNKKKLVIDDISQSLNGKQIKFNLGFMSANPKYYKQLTANTDMVQVIEKRETEINQIPFYYIESKDISAIEPKLKSGDIIAIVMDNKGLDYSHTGLILKKDGTAHFMHASSKQKKVIIDHSISEYCKSNKSALGITVLRPKEV